MKNGVQFYNKAIRSLNAKPYGMGIGGNLDTAERGHVSSLIGNDDNILIYTWSITRAKEVEIYIETLVDQQGNMVTLEGNTYKFNLDDILSDIPSKHEGLLELILSASKDQYKIHVANYTRVRRVSTVSDMCIMRGE